MGRCLSLQLGTIVDGTLIHAPSSARNKERKRDPCMHKTKKGDKYDLGAMDGEATRWRIVRSAGTPGLITRGWPP